MGLVLSSIFTAECFALNLILVEQHWAPTRLIYEDTSTGIYQRHALYHWIGNFV